MVKSDALRTVNKKNPPVREWEEVLVTRDPEGVREPEVLAWSANSQVHIHDYGDGDGPQWNLVDIAKGWLFDEWPLERWEDTFDWTPEPGSQQVVRLEM